MQKLSPSLKPEREKLFYYILASLSDPAVGEQYRCQVLPREPVELSVVVK